MNDDKTVALVFGVPALALMWLSVHWAVNAECVSFHHGGTSVSCRSEDPISFWGGIIGVGAVGAFLLYMCLTIYFRKSPPGK